MGTLTNQEYIRRLEKIEAVLDTYLHEKPGEAWMTIHFPDSQHDIPSSASGLLTAPAYDILKRGGKRWRPMLMLLICEALGGEDKSLPLTPLVEFSHNASLIHDDVEDNSDERRGEPAIHIKYGVDTAINTGSFLYFLSLSCMAQWQAAAEKKYQVFALWGEAMRKLHLGQAMDISWHRDFSSLPSIEDYNLMCRLKTGTLASLAATLGVIAVGLKDEIKEKALIKAFSSSAEKLGKGFQILDDVKNLTTGNPGKKRGDDIVEGKKSLPVLFYLHEREDKREFVSHCFNSAREKGTSASEVEELIHELTKSGALKKAEEAGNACINEAKDVFSEYVDGKLLSELLDTHIIERKL